MGRECRLAMTLREAIVSLAVATAAGGLVGVERQQAQAGQEGTEFGGIRTFPLVALLGAVSALLVPFAGLWIIGGAFVALGALLTVTHVRAAENDLGISTEIAALVTFALGAIAAASDLMPYQERYLLVASSSAIVMALLALKTPLHGFAAKVSRDDMYATTRFVLLGLVVLPLLPNRTYGPLDVLNPFKIGLMIVLVAGIGFTGYVASRAIGGRRGLLATGLLGGLVSSTAVTLTFSGRAKKDRRAAALCAVAVLAASATMFPRVLVVVLVADRELVPQLLIPLGAMGIVGFGAAWGYYRREMRSENPSEVPLRNPFALRQAIQFGLIYGLILFVAKAAQVFVGQKGIYASSVLAGLTDVDAITLSLTELHRGGLAPATASVGIILAVFTNTIVKVVLAFSVGGKEIGRRVGIGLFAVLSAGVGGGLASTLVRPPSP
jgi:uncharacterized membrane protein (DUF4010 family)